MSNLYADRVFNAVEKVDPEPGMLLVAAPGMASLEFARTVVLILEHNSRSTFGVVLNRRSDTPVANAMEEWLPAVAKPQAFYIGGPLGRQAVVGLGVTRVGVDMNEHEGLRRLANRLAYVHLNMDPEEMASLLSGLRLFVGYAEWAPGQLAEEIAAGEWFVTPALPGDVIYPARGDLWSDVLRRQPMPLPLFATFPAVLLDS